MFLGKSFRFLWLNCVELRPWLVNSMILHWGSIRNPKKIWGIQALPSSKNLSKHPIQPPTTKPCARPGSSSAWFASHPTLHQWPWQTHVFWRWWQPTIGPPRWHDANQSFLRGLVFYDLCSSYAGILIFFGTSALQHFIFWQNKPNGVAQTMGCPYKFPHVASHCCPTRVFLYVFCAAFANRNFSSGHESNKFQVSAPQWYDHISDGLAGSLGTKKAALQEPEGTDRVFWIPPWGLRFGAAQTIRYFAGG